MKKNIIQVLEETIGSVDNLTYEQVCKILSKNNVYNELDNMFASVLDVDHDDIDSLTSSHAVKQVIYHFLRKKNVLFKRTESVSISQLNSFLIDYHHKVSRIPSKSDEEIETLLSNRTNPEVFNDIVNSLLNFVFLEVLRFSTDEVMFDDLLTEGNNSLINSICSYDKKIHGSFMEYFKFNLYDTLALKSNPLSNNLISIEGSELSYKDFQDVVVSRVVIDDYIKDIINNSKLTAKEKLVLCYRFGLVDSNQYSPIDVAELLGINRTEELVIETSAIKKIKSLHKLPKDILE